MSGGGFLLIIVAFAFLYFILVRPQKRRQVEQSRLLSSIEIGDEVVTAGGIYGHVRSIDDGDLMVEIAPDVQVRIARRAIGGVIKPEADDADVEAVQAEADEAEETRAPADDERAPVAEDGG